MTDKAGGSIPTRGLLPTAALAGAFLSELAMLALLATSGAELADPTPLRVTLAVGLPLLTAGFWGRWLAPRAARRIGARRRLAVKMALFLATGALGTLAGHPEPAAAFVVVAAVTTGAAHVLTPDEPV